MATSISTVGARDKLKAQHEPHWMKLGKGCYLGFQKLTATSTGSWIARYRHAETGKQHKRSLGDYEFIQAATDRFDAAKKDAEAWFEHLGKGGSTEAKTIRAACEAYEKEIRETKGDDSADDLNGRFTRWVYGNKAFAERELTQAREQHFREWRRSLAKTPAKVSRDSRETPLTRARSASTVNRDVTALRAALNFALTCRLVVSDIEWRTVLKPTKNADGRRDLYLDRSERRKLVEHAGPDLALLLRTLSMLPLRPGALALLDARHFDKRLAVVTVGKDKAGKDRKITLPPATAAIFAEAAKDKLPSAPLLTRADGRRWDKDAWKGPIKDAAAAGELPAATTAYALRHSVITDLVTGGLDLLTVAQLSGTSVAMIERHYGHLRADHAAAALAGLAL